MAAGKQTPRQKMINLMYLVFIAMMALNIDAEIIRSYYDSTKALNETRTLTERKNEKIFEKTLEAKAQQVPDTYAQPWAQYQVLRDKINVLVKSAQEIKDVLKKKSEFHDKDAQGKDVDVSENFAALNNNEATTEYFFKEGDENTPSKGALELKAKSSVSQMMLRVTPATYTCRCSRKTHIRITHAYNCRDTQFFSMHTQHTLAKI